MSNERLIEIETRLAYQEDTIQALNQVICRQQDQIDKLEARCQMLIDRMTTLMEASDIQPGDEKPPHY